jgi:hypothetical protein
LVALQYERRLPIVVSTEESKGIDTLRDPWVPRAIQTLRHFRAPDPWTGDAAAEWTLNWYTFETNPRGRRSQEAYIKSRIAKSPLADAAKRKQSGVLTGIETAGRYHLLARMLAKRWRCGECEDQALPLLLHRIEPRLRRTDFTIVQKLILIGAGYLMGIVGWPLAGAAVYFWLTDVPEGYKGMGMLAAVSLVPFFAASAAHLLQRRHDRQIDGMIGDLLVKSGAKQLSQRSG